MFDQIVGKEGAFQKAVDGIARALRYKIPLTANMVVMLENRHQVIETGRFLSKLGVTRFSATKVIPSLSCKTPDVLRLSPDDVIKIMDDLLLLKAELGLQISTLTCYPKCLFVDMEKYGELLLQRSCSGGKTTGAIGANGEVRACPHLDEVCGNAVSESLLDIWPRLIRIASGVRAKTLIVLGGEPTVYEHVLAVGKYAAELGLKPCLVTNGILLHDKEYIERLIDAGYSSVTVSLKAGNADQFKEVTRTNGFEKVIKAISNLAEKRVSGGVTITLSKYIESNLDQVVKAAADAGAAHVKIDFGSPIINLDGSIDTTHVLNPKEAAKCIERHFPAIERVGCPVALEISLPFCLFSPEFIQDVLSKKIVGSGCQMLSHSGLLFGPVGEIYSCNHLTNAPVGRIDQDFSDIDSFKQFWNSEAVHGLFEMYRSVPSEECLNCDYYESCCGGCRVKWLCYNPAEFNLRRQGVKS